MANWNDVDFNNYKCLDCGYICINRRSLGNHLVRTHSTTMEFYALKHYYNNQIPFCLCGCQTSVVWHKLNYRYNQYITGHNGGYTSENQPKFTEEQIEKRNNSIRKAYEEKGEQISEKISQAVNKALENEKYRITLSKAQKKRWDEPGAREQASIDRKKVWEERYDELYEKIFTPEFGKKISVANMNRDIKIDSKEQNDFKQKLISIFGIDDIISPCWINDKERTLSPDYYIKSHKVYIEWDGEYYHSINTKEEFSLKQINSIRNDLEKNRIMKKLNKNYLRISSNVNVEEIKDFDSLVEKSYHVYLNGNILKEGTFKLESDTTKIISRNKLIEINNNLSNYSEGKKFTEKEILPLLSKFLRGYVNYWGWFYPEDKNDLENVIIELQTLNIDNSKILSSLDRVGTSYLKSVFQSFWNTEEGPVKSFFDDNKLKNVLRYRLGLNNSKLYEYYVPKYGRISTNETFDITFKNIRKGFVVQRNTVSFFKPSVAYKVYKTFLTDIPYPKVWDPSSGFGARLLGFVANFPNRGKYIGCEPALETYRDLSILKSKINKYYKTDIELYNKCSESFELNERVDLVFTSPPYFNKEKYFNEDTQCWKKYSNTKEWEEGFLKPIFETAFKNLKNNGKMVINIDEVNKKIITDTALAMGFELIDEWKLNIGSDHFSPDKESNFEPILIFQKP